jgi:hypothetical protein
VGHSFECHAPQIFAISINIAAASLQARRGLGNLQQFSHWPGQSTYMYRTIVIVERASLLGP